MRYDGQPAIALAITNQPGVNVVELGKRVDARLAELIADLPVGIEVHRVHWQSELIDAAVRGFFVSLAQAVLIVLAVLWLAMGWRMGVIIGSSIILTILGTFVVMAGTGIDLQRMSLGAMIIALGMMVDNSIVVAEGALVRMQRGMDRVEGRDRGGLAAGLAAAWRHRRRGPGVLSDRRLDRERRRVLRLAVLGCGHLAAAELGPLGHRHAAPMRAAACAPRPRQAGDTPRTGGLIRGFRAAAREPPSATGSSPWRPRPGCSSRRLSASAQVTKLFFPDSSMPKFLLDYRLAEGARIEAVAEDLEGIEKKLLGDSRVAGVASFIGAGPPRFYLPVDPEPLSPNYGQLVVNLHDHRDVGALMDELEPWLQENYPQAQVLLRPFAVGPGLTWKFEARISGPALASGDMLRALAAKGEAILRQSPLTASRADQLAAARAEVRAAVQRRSGALGRRHPRGRRAQHQAVARGLDHRCLQPGGRGAADRPARQAGRGARQRHRGACAACRSGPPTAPRPCLSTRSSTASRIRWEDPDHLAPRPQANHHRCRPTRSAASPCRPTWRAWRRSSRSWRGTCRLATGWNGAANTRLRQSRRPR